MKIKVTMNFVKIVADMAIFLEFTSNDLLNEDVAIEMMEQLANHLQNLSEEEKFHLVEQLKELSLAYADEKKAVFLRELPESFGLINSRPMCD